MIHQTQNISSLIAENSDFNYCYLTLTLLFNIHHLSTNSEVVTSIAI